MAWARIDTDLFDHPKMAAVGPLAAALHIRAVLYSASHETDGRVPRRIVETWQWEIGRDAGLPVDVVPDLARRLVQEGAWLEDDAAFYVASFTDYQRSHAEVEAIREKRRAAGRKGGLARSSKNEANADFASDFASTDSGSQSGIPGKREANAKQRAPHEHVHKNVKSKNRTMSIRGSTVPSEGIDEVWSAYHAHHPAAKLTKPRRDLIRRRLGDGYTEAQLVEAVEGCHRSAWHQGQNDRGRRYDSIELILRDAGKVEQFIALAHRPPVERVAARRGKLSARDLAALAAQLEAGAA